MKVRLSYDTICLENQKKVSIFYNECLKGTPFLMKIIDGISMMGCKTVITGLRAEVVRKMIHMEVSFNPEAKTLGTLQQELKEHLNYLQGQGIKIEEFI